jgi:uncharacterized protein (DUF58 family)
MDKKLQTILLKAKEDVYSHLSGGNMSRILGQGYDFAELREYESSDDIRHISWINSAKLGQPYVKKMHEERELNVAVCTMVDGRFLLGKKRELLEYVVAVLGYSAYEANDLFSAFTFVGSELKHYEPTKNLYAIEKVIEDIAQAELLGKKIDYKKGSNIELESKHLLFMVGDFLDFVDLSVLAQKHEVVVIMVRDEQEENLKASVDAQLIDPQINKALNQTLSKRAIEHYRAKFLEHDEILIEHFYKHNISYIKVYKSEELIGELESLFTLN